MKRLTKKILPEYGMHYKANNGVSMLQYNNKLGRLEDIEEELGISLEILFKALKNGIYVKFGNKKITKGEIYIHKYILPRHFHEEEKGWAIDLTIELSMNAYLYFKDYGKTWALTEEDLK